MVRTRKASRKQNNNASSKKRIKTCGIRTRKASRKQNNNASSKKRIKTCGNGGGAPWSDLNPDVLYSVMTRLGVVDFISFSGVCKSWRSLALSNRKSFMASRPPMLMYVYPGPYTKTCCLQDFEGRLFNTIIPHSVGRTCVGLTSGYLILFGEETHDFWLVNPITRYELHFPDVPFHVDHPLEKKIRAILVFSRSINAWVFVVVNRFTYKVWFSIANKGTWNNVSTGTNLVFDVHAFKGKIYTLNLASPPESRHVWEMTLDPVPKLTVLDTRFLEPVSTVFEFTSSDENLYVMDYTLDTYKVHRVGFDEPSCVPCEKTKQEYVLFNSHMKFNFVLRPESWAAPSSLLSGRFFENKRRGEDRLYMAKMWYFPHDCLDVTIIEK